MLHVIQNAFVFVAGKKAIQSAKLLETSIDNCDRIWDRERVTERVKILGNLAIAPHHTTFPQCLFYKAIVITTANRESAVTRECRFSLKVQEKLLHDLSKSVSKR